MAHEPSSMNICPVPEISVDLTGIFNHQVTINPITMKINFVKLWPISLISIGQNMYTGKWGVL